MATDPSDAAPPVAPVAPGARSRNRATMAGEAVSVLREAIIVGDLAPGSPLRLEELAASLGMSISPVREAIRHLEAVGLAEHVAYRGARVTDLNVDDMLEVYEVRTALEAPAARRAAERFADADDVLLSAILDELEEAYHRQDLRAIVHGNTAFHTELARTSSSRWAQRLLEPTFETSERYAAALLQAGGLAETMAIEAEGHREILDACRAHDPERAEEAMRRHLDVFRGAFDTLLSELIRRDEWPPPDADCRLRAAADAAAGA